MSENFDLDVYGDSFAEDFLRAMANDPVMGEHTFSDNPTSSGPVIKDGEIHPGATDINFCDQDLPDEVLKLMEENPAASWADVQDTYSGEPHSLIERAIDGGDRGPVDPFHSSNQATGSSGLRSQPEDNRPSGQDAVQDGGLHDTGASEGRNRGNHLEHYIPTDSTAYTITHASIDGINQAPLIPKPKDQDSAASSTSSAARRPPVTSQRSFSSSSEDSHLIGLTEETINAFEYKSPKNSNQENLRLCHECLEFYDSRDNFATDTKCALCATSPNIGNNADDPRLEAVEKATNVLPGFQPAPSGSTANVTAASNFAPQATPPAYPVLFYPGAVGYASSLAPGTSLPHNQLPRPTALLPPWSADAQNIMQRQFVPAPVLQAKATGPQGVQIPSVSIQAQQQNGPMYGPHIDPGIYVQGSVGTHFNVQSAKTSHGTGSGPDKVQRRCRKDDAEFPANRNNNGLDCTKCCNAMDREGCNPWDPAQSAAWVKPTKRNPMPPPSVPAVAKQSSGRDFSLVGLPLPMTDPRPAQDVAAALGATTSLPQPPTSSSYQTCTSPPLVAAQMGHLPAPMIQPAVTALFVKPEAAQSAHKSSNHPSLSTAPQAASLQRVQEGKEARRAQVPALNKTRSGITESTVSAIDPQLDNSETKTPAKTQDHAPANSGDLPTAASILLRTPVASHSSPPLPTARPAPTLPQVGDDQHTPAAARHQAPTWDSSLVATVDQAELLLLRPEEDDLERLLVVNDDWSHVKNVRFGDFALKVFEALTHGSAPAPADFTVPQLEYYNSQQSSTMNEVMERISGNKKRVHACVMVLLSKAIAVHEKGVDKAVLSKRAAVDQISTCSQRVEKVIHAVSGNKLVALDVLQAKIANMEALVRSPDRYSEQKISYLRSNVNRKLKSKQTAAARLESGQSSQGSVSGTRASTPAQNSDQITPSTYLGTPSSMAPPTSPRSPSLQPSAGFITSPPTPASGTSSPQVSAEAMGTPSSSTQHMLKPGVTVYDDRVGTSSPASTRPTNIAPLSTARPGGTLKRARDAEEIEDNGPRSINSGKRRRVEEHREASVGLGDTRLSRESTAAIGRISPVRQPAKRSDEHAPSK